MKTLTLRSDKHPASLILALDEANGRAVVLARASDEQTQVPYLELNFADMSVSVFNSSDLGVTVDNSGLVTVHRSKIEGELIMQSPESGQWFSFRPNAAGALVGIPIDPPV